MLSAIERRIVSLAIKKSIHRRDDRLLISACVFGEITAASLFKRRHPPATASSVCTYVLRSILRHSTSTYIVYPRSTERNRMRKQNARARGEIWSLRDTTWSVNAFIPRDICSGSSEACLKGKVERADGDQRGESRGKSKGTLPTRGQRSASIIAARGIMFNTRSSFIKRSLLCSRAVKHEARKPGAPGLRRVGWSPPRSSGASPECLLARRLIFWTRGRRETGFNVTLARVRTARRRFIK